MRRAKKGDPDSGIRVALPSGLAALLPMLRRGAVTTDEFLRRTRGDFERMAADLRRRFGGARGRRAWPSDVGDEDVANRMRMLAVEGVAKWDPTRGVSLTEFVVYRCRSKVLRWTNQRRGARKAGDDSRSAVLVSDAFPSERDEQDFERVSRLLAERDREWGCVLTEQQRRVEAGELLGLLKSRGLLAVDVSVEGAVEAFEASKGLRELARRVLLAVPMGAGDRSRIAGRVKPVEVESWSRS